MAAVVSRILIRAAAEAGALTLLDGAFERAFDALALGGFAPELAYLLQRTGANARAGEILTRADRVVQQAIDKGNASVSLVVALAHSAAVRGEQDASLDLIERAERMGHSDVFAMREDPIYAPLLDHPRFRVISARMQTRVDEMRRRVERLDQ